MALDALLTTLIRTGSLTVRFADGRTRRYGDGDSPRAAVAIADKATERRLLFDPQLALGEAYMDNRLTVEAGDIKDLLDIAMINLGRHRRAEYWPQRALRRARFALRRVRQFNPTRRAKRNVAHHYDLSDGLYELFLDSDRQYSCAHFEQEDDSLERAQERKKRHIAAKLLVEPGMRVLDVGCGWGGMAIYLARRCGAKVLGITLSEEQAKFARRRVADEGLENAVEIRVEDYRATRERFDRIVSVGMFEHVGVNHYDAFHRTLADRLESDGIALLHTIARSEGPSEANPWIAKYIFPGAYIPAVSEVMPSIERNGLFLTDLEILRLHYAKTLAHWRRRFRAAWDKAAALYDERFCRMWDFYLASSETAFQYGGLMVTQFQIAKNQAAVPLTRDYIDAFKRDHPVAAN